MKKNGKKKALMACSEKIAISLPSEAERSRLAGKYVRGYKKHPETRKEIEAAEAAALLGAECWN